MQKEIESFLDGQLQTRVASFVRDLVRKELTERLGHIFRSDAVGSLLGDDDGEHPRGERLLASCDRSSATATC
jgi:hypothetical protein